MQNALETSSASAKLLLAAEKSENSKANRSLVKFSAANRSFADVVSEDDVSRAFCIPPTYTKNFDKNHFFKKFRKLEEV